MTDPLPDWAYRDLSPEEEKEFRDHARDIHDPGDEINGLWHPVVKDECEKIDAEVMQNGTGSNQ